MIAGPSGFKDANNVSNKANFVLWHWCLLVLSITGIYLFGLGNPFIPSNGDEAPYLNITRNLLEHQQWLPLLSDTESLTNTKPPMLFWQGKLVSNISAQFELFSLRLPSVIYSLLTGLLIVFLVLQWQRDWRTAWFALALYFSFISTFRFGRPFLTNAPETFWLFATLALYLYYRQRNSDKAPGWPVLLAMSISTGIALLYKSFVLIAPMWMAFGLLEWHRQNWRINLALWRSFWLFLGYGGLALALFSLWFALDSNPQAIWQDFVIGENFHKLDQQQNYWFGLLLGPDNFFSSIILGYLLNSGLLVIPLLGLVIFLLWKRPKLDNFSQQALLIILAFMLFYTLPSQRSSRYLLPVMPFAAMMLAHYRLRLPQWLIQITSLLLLLAIVILLSASHGLQQHVSGQHPFTAAIAVIALGIAVFWLISWRRADTLWPTLVAAGFGFLFSISLVLVPFNGPMTQFQHLDQLRQSEPLAVPVRFIHKEEYWRFKLPGITLVPYYDVPPKSESEILQGNKLALVLLPLGEEPVCQSCRIMDKALSFNSRLGSLEQQRFLKSLDWGVFFRQAWIIENLKNPQ